MTTPCLALAAFLAAAPSGTRLAALPFTSLAELDAAAAALERGGDAEAFWARVEAAGSMPLVYGETAVFLHRSKADRVEWRGDFTGWRSAPEAQGRRLGKSDIWTFRRDFLRDARLDYKIVEIAENWLVDPLNPRRQLGGYQTGTPGGTGAPPPPKSSSSCTARPEEPAGDFPDRRGATGASRRR